MSLPADPQRGASGSCWFRATSQTRYVTVRSQVGWFMGHWSPKARGSCRCLGDLCPICAAGSEPRPFYYIAVVEDGSEIKFLEIPRRHRTIAEDLESSKSKGVGFELMVKKDGRFSNSPILMEVVGFADCEEFDIWSFVSTLGRSLLPIPAEDSPKSLSTQSESDPLSEKTRSAM